LAAKALRRKKASEGKDVAARVTMLSSNLQRIRDAE
jgi:hypothetical protein